MRTVVHEGESPCVQEAIEDAGSIDHEADGGIIKGILWALAIVVPIYAVLLWALMPISSL